IALGTYAGLGNLAPGIFSIVLPLYLTRFGFISAYFAWFLFLILGIILYAAVAENSYYFQFRKAGLTVDRAKAEAQELGQEIFPSGGVKESLVSSAKIMNTWALVVLYFTTFGGFIALTAWFPTYWSEYQHFDPVMAGLLTAVFSILASLVRVFGGKIADKSGGEKTILFSMSLILVSALLLSFLSEVFTIVAIVILLAVGMGISNAAIFKLVPAYVPGAVGGASGWIGGLGAFGGFALPPLMGAIAGKYGAEGYARGFLVFVVLSVVNLLIIYILIRRHKAETKRRDS
ncbi:MAG: MFS transporter, partial [Bacteroidales bacterium]|nr:MFS transporter [Bacteroidales bacterium]